MSTGSVTGAPRLPVNPDQLVGRVLHIPADHCRYREMGFALLVRCVRLDISQWYGGAWVWLEGDELTDAGYSLGWTQALVHVSVCQGRWRAACPPGDRVPAGSSPAR
jgi:hypothetical protein